MILVYVKFLLDETWYINLSDSYGINDLLIKILPICGSRFVITVIKIV
jgi:hypothetical protein